MAKKLTLLGMVVAALAAFAIPAAASASPVLKMSGTEAVVPVGTSLTGTSTNAETTNTPVGTLKCSKVVIKAELTENSGSSIKATGKAGETATCTAGSKSLTVTEPKLTTLSTSSGDAGTLGLSFTADVGETFKCKYETSGATAAFTYTTGSGNLVIPGATLKSPTSVLCEPEEGTITFKGTFALTTTAGGGVFVA